MPGVHHTLTPSPEEDIYTKDEVMEIIKKGMIDQDKMYDKMHQTMDTLLSSPQQHCLDKQNNGGAAAETRIYWMDYLEEAILIYHRFYPFLAMVYRCF